jgi:hypothetical protein
MEHDWHLLVATAQKDIHVNYRNEVFVLWFPLFLPLCDYITQQKCCLINKRPNLLKHDTETDTEIQRLYSYYGQNLRVRFAPLETKLR